MKKLLLFAFLFCLGLSFAVAQETKDNATYYYNLFDDNTSGSLTFVNSALQITPTSTTNNLNVSTGRALRNTTSTTAGSVYTSYIPAGTSLANDDWEWSFLYKNTGTTVSTNPQTIANNTNTWRYWLMADGTTGSTAAGFYITEYNGNLVIRYKYANDAANPGNFNIVASYAISTNTTYAIKVQRLKIGMFKLYVDVYSASTPEAKTLRVTGVYPGGPTTYNYSMLECSGTGTAGRFLFDDLKFYTRQFQFVSYPSGLTTAPVGPSQAGTIIYSVELKMRGNYEFKQLQLSESPAATTYLTSETLYKSADGTFTPTVPAPDVLVQTGGGTGYYSNINDSYQSSGGTDGSLTTVGYYYVAGTTKSSLTAGTLTFGGISSITTQDVDGAPGYTGYNSGGSTSSIAFTTVTVAYSSPQTYTVGTAITNLTPTTTGTPTSYSASGLPPGLSINSSTGVISGTPTTSSPATNYTITASNAGGSNTATLNITVNGPPVISYASPQTYNVGTAISTLSPTSTGTAVGGAGYSAAVNFKAVTDTYEVDADPSGNVYSVNGTNGDLYKWNSAGTGGTINTTNLVSPSGLGVDHSGNIWVSDFVSGSTYNVLKFSSTGTLLATITGFNQPYGIDFDSNNNAYIVNLGTNSIIKVAAGTTTKTTYITGLSSPYGIAIDPSDNIFVSSSVNNNVVKIPAGTTTASTFATGFNTPKHLSADNAGNIYVADYGNNAIKKITPTGTVSTLLTSTSVSNPRGAVVDPSGNLYIANNGTSYVKKAAPTGNYFIDKTLPSGLSFNSTTGQITGTPTVEQAATTYTITAYNAYGSGTATVSITVNPAVPVITYTTPQTYTAGTAITSLSPTNTGGTPTSYSISPTLPTGLSFNTSTGVISGTPTAESSATVYTISATNAGGTGTFALTITVNPALPNISYTTPQTYSVGTAITSLSPTNTGGTVASYSVSPTLPAGLSINTTTGVISGTPTAPSGATTYTVTATNVTGSDTYDITITVNLPVSVGNYAFNQSITIKTGSMGISSTLTNFPVLVYIKEDALKSGVNCANNIQYPTGGTNGYDFAFTTSSGANELYYQVESFDSSTGTLLAWVQVPSVTNADQTLKFYFGSSSPNHPAAFTSGTWDTDYLAVYHFNETPSSGSATADATSNGRTGTTSNMVSTDLVTGKIGTAYNFNGSNKAVSATSATVTGPFTISAWVYLNAIGNDQKIITNQATGGSSTGGYKLGVYSTNTAEAESATAINRTSTPAAPTFSTGTWYYVQGVYTGSTLSTYVNGSQYKILATTTSPTATTPLYIGVGEGGNTFFFNGRIDEPRVSNVAKSSDWLKAEYYNQNNYTTFTTASTAITGTYATSAPLGASLVYTWTGASGTNIASATNWTAPASGNPSLAPPTDGTASIVIPTGLTNYPVLTSNASFFGVTLGATATIDLNGYTLSVGCNVYNSSGGKITSTNTASGLTWNGVSATQTYTGTTTANTAKLGNLTINNSAGGTVTISGGPVDVYTSLTLSQGSLTVASSATLTLKSTATQTASVGVITSPSVITGNVNVERYMTGALLARRGYRLMSSPVTQSTVGGQPAYGFKDLQLTAPITGYGATGTYSATAPTNAFDNSSTGNPTVFFYYEPDPDPSSKIIARSDYKGISSISDYFPRGNGFLFFFRGDRTTTDNTGANPKMSTLAVPQNTTLNFTGTLNQGTVNVYIPTSPITTVSGNKVYSTAAAATLSSTFSYTANTGSNNGLHLVGNPYASAIDLEAITLSNPGSTSIYMLNNAGVLSAYVKGSNSTTLVNGVGRYVLSGQGFFITAKSTNNTSLTFTESAKVSSVAAASTPTSFSFAKQSQLAATKQTLQSIQNTGVSSGRPQQLLIKLSLDSVNNNETLIQFGGNTNKYNPMEDAYYGYGLSQTTFLASYTSDAKPCIINHMSTLDSVKTIPLYAEGQTNGVYKLDFSGMSTIDPRYKLVLMDHYTKDSLELVSNAVYSFNIDRGIAATYGDKRFEIVVRPTNIGNYYHLTEFKGVKETQGVVLTWKTEYEGDYTGFTIERSLDGGQTYIPIGSFQSSNKGSYQFTDKSPALNVTAMYRLVQNDINNVDRISKVVTIGYQPISDQLTTFQVFPNPAVNTIKFNVKPDTKASSLNVKIYNMSGVMVSNAKYSASGTLSQDVSKLQQGGYVIYVTDSSNNLYGTATFTKH